MMFREEKYGQNPGSSIKEMLHFLPFRLMNCLMPGFISTNTPMVLDNIQEI
jgi:hypothetical protein